MKYRLTVEQFEPNPNYPAELKEANERQRWSAPPVEYPSAERIVKVLSVEITDVEWQAVKKAALATMA